MEYKTIQWNREKLYEQIWTNPLRTVAKEYGLSDVGLAKICKKLNIPRPGLGYWRRKEGGFKVNRPALPAVKNDLRLVSHVPIAAPPKPMKVPDNSLPPLIVPAVTATVHTLVKQTAHAFSGRRTADQFGRLRAANWRLGRLDIRVTSAGLQRALKFVDSLVKLLEANGMNVSVASEREPVATKIGVDGEQVKVVLKEAVRGRKRDLTAEENATTSARLRYTGRISDGLTIPPTGLLLKLRALLTGSANGVTPRVAKLKSVSIRSPKEYYLRQHMGNASGPNVNSSDAGSFFPLSRKGANSRKPLLPFVI